MRIVWILLIIVTAAMIAVKIIMKIEDDEVEKILKRARSLLIEERELWNEVLDILDDQHKQMLKESMERSGYQEEVDRAIERYEKE